MQTLKLTILLSVLTTITALPLFAQDTENKPVREVGFGTYNLSNNFALIYKKELEENKYRRYDASVGFMYANLSSGSNDEVSIASFSFTLSTENRRYLNDKFKFVHGLFYGVHISSTSQNDQSTVRLGPNVGYQLGVQYDINEQFYIGATTFPGIRTELSFSEGEVWFSGVNLSFSPTAEVSLLYRF